VHRGTLAERMMELSRENGVKPLELAVQ